MVRLKRSLKVKQKKEIFDLHFVFSKPNLVIQTFLEEAKNDDRDMTAQFQRILRERYQIKEQHNE